MLAQQKKKVILQKNASKLFRKLVQQREFYAKDAMILDPLIEQVEKYCFEETYKEDIETAEELAERLYLLVIEKYKAKRHDEKVKYRPFVNEKPHHYHFATVVSAVPQDVTKSIAAVKKRERMTEYTNKLKEAKQRKLNLQAPMHHPDEHFSLQNEEHHQVEEIYDTDEEIFVNIPKTFRGFENLKYLQEIPTPQETKQTSPHFSPTKEALVDEVLRQVDREGKLDSLLQNEITPPKVGKSFSKQIDEMYAKIMRDTDIVQDELLSSTYLDGENAEQFTNRVLIPQHSTMLEDTINFDSQLEKLDRFNPYPSYSPRYYMAKDSATRNFVHDLHSPYSKSVIVGHVLPFVKPLYFSPQVERDKFRKELNHYNNPLLSPISSRSPIVQNQRQQQQPLHSFSTIPHLPPIKK